MTLIPLPTDKKWLCSCQYVNEKRYINFALCMLPGGGDFVTEKYILLMPMVVF